MLRTFRAAATALLLTTVTGAAQAQSAAMKFGYVNTESLMAVAPGKAAAESVYNREVLAFTAQQKKWTDSLTKLFESYKKEEPKLTEGQKATKQAFISAVQQEFDAKNQSGQQKMQTRQSELLAPLMELVKKAIDDIRTEDGYAIIFSGDANSPIVSADKNLDITDRVVSRLKTIAAKAPAPPSSMAPAAVVKKPPTR